MTKESIAAVREQLKNDDLYLKSTSPYKEYQFKQITQNGKALSGTHSKMESIKGKIMPVIFRFNENGLLNTYREYENDNGMIELPAIEYHGHWEYWERGLLVKVVDVPTKTVEKWKDGFPIEITTAKKGVDY